MQEVARLMLLCRQLFHIPLAPHQLDQGTGASPASSPSLATLETKRDVASRGLQDDGRLKVKVLSPPCPSRDYKSVFNHSLGQNRPQQSPFSALCLSASSSLSGQREIPALAASTPSKH